MIHTVKGFSAINEEDVGIFLEFSCLFYDPVDFGNLISDSSGFSKCSLNIWKFTVHILLKPGLENFEDHFPAAAAKSLQSCPTLCDPIDSSPPCSPIPGILHQLWLLGKPEP